MTKAFKTNLAVQSHWYWNWKRRIYFFDAIHLAYVFILFHNMNAIFVYGVTLLVFGICSVEYMLHWLMLHKPAPMQCSKLPCCITPRLQDIDYIFQANDGSMAKMDQWQRKFTMNLLVGSNSAVCITKPPMEKSRMICPKWSTNLGPRDIRNLNGNWTDSYHKYP